MADAVFCPWGSDSRGERVSTAVGIPPQDFRAANQSLLGGLLPGSTGSSGYSHGADFRHLSHLRPGPPRRDVGESAPDSIAYRYPRTDMAARDVLADCSSASFYLGRDSACGSPYPPLVEPGSFPPPGLLGGRLSQANPEAKRLF